MQNQGAMELILIGILLLCGYLYLFQTVAKRTENKSALPVLAVVLLALYALIAIPLVLIFSRLGSTDMILMALLLLIACGVLFSALWGLGRNFAKVNKGMLALFLVYALAVAYITVFSRDGGNDTSVHLFRFDMIEEAVRARSLEPMNHMLLNVALFVPLGALLPMILPEKLEKWLYPLLMGLMATTVIEAVQMILRLGQADLTDIVTNVLGALLGYGLYRALRRFRRAEE